MLKRSEQIERKKRTINLSRFAIKNRCRRDAGGISAKNHQRHLQYRTIIADHILIGKKIFERLICVMKNRKFYEDYFSAYPDVVALDQFRKMLGGMGDVQARRLMQQNHVKHFFIRGTYLIPKANVIDYILSTHYARYRIKLKAQIP